MKRRAAVGVLAALLGGGGLLLIQPRPATPATNSPEAQFVRHMIVHHEQALGLSAPVLKRSEDRSLRSVALDITLGQTEQLRQMRAWLAGWGLSPGTRLTPAEATEMGLASIEEFESLSSLPPPQAEALFLRLMIRHHQGAVAMSAPLQNSPQPNVRRLARQTMTTQKGEIATMESLLRARGEDQTIAPAPAAPGHQH